MENRLRNISGQSIENCVAYDGMDLGGGMNGVPKEEIRGIRQSFIVGD